MTQSPQKLSRPRRGMTSALAMIYLTIIAMLSVGFYTAVDLGSSVADNEQNITRANTSAEVGLAFARYQLSQISLPGNTTQANLLTAVYTALAANLNGTPSMGGNNPTTQPSGTPTSIYIPGQLAGAPTWMSTDSAGGQTYIAITQVPSTMNLQVLAVAQNSNSRITPIKRKVQINFNSAGGFNPVFTYGLISYGEIILQGNVKIKGSNVLAVVSAGNPLNATGSGNLFSGNFYWTDAVASNKITWGTMTVGGFLSSSGSFSTVVHNSVATPSKPTFDTSGFVQYCVAGYGGGQLTTSTYSANATTLTNTELAAGTYVFNKALTINGILYLDAGANVTFNNVGAVSLNGCIVEQNGGSGTLRFNGPLTQTSIGSLSGPDFPVGELALTGTAILAPDYSVTFNGVVNTVGSIIGNSLVFNQNTTVVGGSIMNLGTANMNFNSAATLTITPSASTPSGVVGGNYTYGAAPLTYTEVYP